MGFDSLRIFLLWEDFQPTPHSICDSALAHLERVADLAAGNDLSIIVTLFTGHMSGVNWLPEWVLVNSGSSGRFRTVSGGRLRAAGAANWYTNETIRQAQVLLAREVARTLKDHPAL